MEYFILECSISEVDYLFPTDLFASGRKKIKSNFTLKFSISVNHVLNQALFHLKCKYDQGVT